MNLIKQDLKVIKVPKSKALYNAIDGHVDIQINILDEKKRLILINKDMTDEFKEQLKENSINYIESTSTLGSKYPENIFLNALNSKNYFIHNLNYSDSAFKKYITNKKIINVKQGYTKCSILPLKENVLITNDPGIHKTLSNYDFDILLLPFGDIILEGFEYGFIGGVGGMISHNKLALFGDLNHYSYGNEVLKFLTAHNITPVYLKSGKLTDRGSLFVL
ncbi:MAG: hypothetical protein MJ191_03810 [Clostridium sp.]|nr:hypothetical protein [Clostridium sp.]